jgi:hypothetical protein
VAAGTLDLGGEPPRHVAMHVAVVRLSDVESELLLMAHYAAEAAPPQGGSTQISAESCVAASVLATTLRGLRIVDWGLFG